MTDQARMDGKAECVTCVHFKKQVGYLGGQCLRYPPVPTAHYALDGSGNCQFDNLLPYVEDGHHCGEYSAQPKP